MVEGSSVRATGSLLREERRVLLAKPVEQPVQDREGARSAEVLRRGHAVEAQLDVEVVLDQERGLLLAEQACRS